MATADGGAARITLIGRDGCHLCEDAKAVIEAVVAGTGDAFVERDIDAEPELKARYWEQIPVVIVDGRQVASWRIDPDRLRAALAGRPGRRFLGRGTAEPST
jgi:glutaredoxin